ncbi:hypothetical protein FFY77_15010 [Xanthomonas translucens pv. translucens]|nr:hypothetical protein [Xanthomonas translucens pv. translucens]
MACSPGPVAPISSAVRYNSIIALRNPALPLADADDGLVPYRSAHLQGAESELVTPVATEAAPTRSCGTLSGCPVGVASAATSSTDSSCRGCSPYSGVMKRRLSARKMPQPRAPAIRMRMSR